MPPRPDRAALWLLSAAVAGGFVASGIAPYDRLTWFLECLPLFVVMPVLWLTARRFPLTPLLYAGIGVHALGLLLGAAYTFPRVPLGAWLADWLDLSRNPYDRLGHFVQGFVPAIAVREVLLRGGHVQGRRMLPFLTACVVMMFSATYELVEWLAAVSLGGDADEFLGMQGDRWDAQADMLCAFCGAVAMLVLLPRVHDRQLRRLAARERAAQCGPG